MYYKINDFTRININAFSMVEYLKNENENPAKLRLYYANKDGWIVFAVTNDMVHGSTINERQLKDFLYFLDTESGRC